MKTLVLLMIPVFLSCQLIAQDKLTRYFPAGEANANVLIDNYLSPLGEDISVLPNNGWYTTAKTHKQWGFDLSVSVNSVFTSNEEVSYGFPSGLSGLDYNGMNGTNGGVGAPVPNAYGKEGDDPFLLINSGPNTGVEFKGPDGFEPGKEYFMEAQAIYTIQAGVGLFKNTDLRVRFTPNTTISTVEFGNWGVGVMHSLSQYFGGEEKKFAISAFLGYTAINGAVDLSGSYAGSGQEAKITASGFTGQLIASKELSVITFYGAVGFDSGKTDIDIKGEYTVDSYVDINGNEVPLATPIPLSTDPFSYNYDAGGFRFTAGMQLKLGPIILNSDYSFVGDNRVLTFGLGFTVK